MSKRSNPTMPMMPKQEKHEEQLSEMHDALYKLGDKARSTGGDKLMPKGMKSDSRKARKHIGRLHDAMKSCGDGA